ncbi:hypothetical protein [Taklimakanibacter deserti]|uniref:hypothetical protein n=1 Tax=Taklimakanibacter deserti TaxID=2267839 RepID=UPI000E64B8E5
MIAAITFALIAMAVGAVLMLAGYLHHCRYRKSQLALGMFCLGAFLAVGVPQAVLFFFIT